MYKDYIEEVTNRKVIETNSCFVEYFVEDECLVIKNMYVTPEFRGGPVSRALKAFIINLVKLEKCSMLVGELHLNNPNFEKQVENYKNDGYEFSMSESQTDVLVAFKEIKNA